MSGDDWQPHFRFPFDAYLFLEWLNDPTTYTLSPEE